MRISSLSVFLCFLFFIFHEAQAGSKELMIFAALMFLSPSSQQEVTLNSQQELVKGNDSEAIRQLASVRVISDIKPIGGADKIDVATVDGWKVVVEKGLHKIGEKIIYFEIDSILPVKEEFEFLRSRSYKKVSEDKEGFRLRTIRLCGQVSQGLVMPLSLLSSKYGVDVDVLNVGDDVTQALGVVKYEPPGVFRAKAEDVKGSYPGFIKKTEEKRIQNLSSAFNSYKKINFFVSEKLDGTSATFYMKDNEFGVCSRNCELVRSDKNTYWKIAIDNNLESKLRESGRNIAIQGEIVGEGIQSNGYDLKGQKLHVFNIFNIDKHKYLAKKEMLEICKDFDLEICPVISENKNIPDTSDEILAGADGKSVINDKKIREGLVWVSDELSPNKRISFKAISNQYLLGMKKNEKYMCCKKKVCDMQIY